MTSPSQVSLRSTWRVIAASCVIGGLCVAAPARALRPFVTDDARVVGEHAAQLETWIVLDSSALRHNVFGAIGPTEWLELTVGFTHGVVHSGPNEYSFTGPVLQGKVLVLEARDNANPGLAFAAGVLPPAGHGPFVPSGWGGFGYAAVTESIFDEALLVHVNLGVALGDAGATEVRTGVTAGLGVQARIVFGLHVVGELFYGDPYDVENARSAMQGGFRYVFSDRVQVDGTFGTTLEAVGTGPDQRVERWGTLGLRLVSSRFW